MGEDPVRIRRATPADAASLAVFAARTFEETFAGAQSAEDLAMFLSTSYGEPQQRQELNNPQIVTLLAEIGGTLAGYAQVRVQTPPACVIGPAPIELWRFYVDRPWQGRGVARELMEHVHSVGRQLRAGTLWLSVFEHNARAIAFYTKCGFAISGTKDFVVGTDRQTDYVMVADVS